MPSTQVEYAARDAYAASWLAARIRKMAAVAAAAAAQHGVAAGLVGPSPPGLADWLPLVPTVENIEVSQLL